MTLDTIQELLHRRPFEPFKILASSGEAYAVRHPEMAWPIRNAVYIGIGGKGTLPERAAFVSLLHVSAVETLGNGKHR